MSNFKAQNPNDNEFVGCISLIGFIGQKWKVQMTNDRVRNTGTYTYHEHETCEHEQRTRTRNSERRDKGAHVSKQRYLINSTGYENIASKSQETPDIFSLTKPLKYHNLRVLFVGLHAGVTQW